MAKDHRLYMKAVGKIQEHIASGEYRAGSRLPPERELAEQFGVSRPTIREAMIALEAKGLLSVRAGSGNYVNEVKQSRSELGANVSAFELIESRVLIEGEAAALAAEMISADELLELKSAVEQIAAEPPSSSEADRKFHNIVVQATRNRVLCSTIEQLWDAQENLEHIRQAHAAVCERDEQKRIEEHMAIYNAIASRDSQAARQAMRRHFSRMLDALHVTDEERAVNEVRQRASEMRKRFSFDRLVMQ